MRRDGSFWLAMAVAFVLGLLPGLGLTAWQRSASQARLASGTSQLQSREASWAREKAEMTAQLSSAEASVGALSARVTNLLSEVGKLKSTPSTETSVPASTAKHQPEIVARTVQGTPRAGGKVTLIVKVKGDADKVTMRLVQLDTTTTAGGWVQTYTLRDSGISNGVHVWRKTVAVPATRGDYRYFADAYLAGFHTAMPGVSEFLLTVR